MLTFLVIVVVVSVFLAMIFASMNGAVEKIDRETDDAVGKSSTFFGYVKHFLNLIQLLSIIVFYCAVMYIGYLVFKLFQ
jgi:hypothetical protein